MYPATDARRILATTFVANRVDYCNAVLYSSGHPPTTNGTQRRRSSRFGLGKYEHITESTTRLPSSVIKPSNCNNLRIILVYSSHTDSRVSWGHLRQTYLWHSLHRQTLLLVGSHAVWNSLHSFVRFADSFISFRSQLTTYTCSQDIDIVAGPLSAPLIPLNRFFHAL